MIAAELIGVDCRNWFQRCPMATRYERAVKDMLCGQRAPTFRKQPSAILHRN